jgi:hypothetical protein
LHAKNRRSAFKHTHPANLVLIKCGGKARLTHVASKSEDIKANTDDAFRSGPERPHTLKNVGKTTPRFTMVELKDMPYQLE